MTVTVLWEVEWLRHMIRRFEGSLAKERSAMLHHGENGGRAESGHFRPAGTAYPIRGQVSLSR